jgi:hypothetical protein
MGVTLKVETVKGGIFLMTNVTVLGEGFMGRLEGGKEVGYRPQKGDKLTAYRDGKILDEWTE